MNDFYVYIYFRLNGIPCYVGMGRKERWKAHLKPKCANRHLRGIVKAANYDLPVVIIRRNLSKIEASQTEILFIKAIGRLDLGTGPLVNLTDGGYFVDNLSLETRKRMSDAAIERMSDPAARENLSRHRKGSKLSDETRAKISAKGRGRPLSEKNKIGIAAALKGKKKSPEHRAAMSQQQTGKPRGPISNTRRTAIKSAVTAFWAKRKSAGILGQLGADR